MLRKGVLVSFICHLYKSFIGLYIFPMGTATGARYSTIYMEWGFC